jgi:hypothetical protein
VRLPLVWGIVQCCPAVDFASYNDIAIAGSTFRATAWIQRAWTQKFLPRRVRWEE